MRPVVIPLFALMWGFTALADEGMWRPQQLTLTAKALRAAGVTVDPARLADLQRGPLASVVSLGGCSASFVSPDGLVATNHHCVVGALQYASVARGGDSLLESGLTAQSRAEEPWAGPSARVRVTVSETDVTAEFAAVIAAASTEAAAALAVESTLKAKVAACEQGRPGHQCQVARYDGGTAFVLIDQLVLRDVRLVHAPPRAVGDYGGDVDNWMWPRHSGDWALLRAYVGPDGQPADHAAANVPFKPAAHLTVNPAGVKASDAVLVAGYPGRTFRHRTATELELTEKEYPATLKMLGELLTLVRELQGRSKALETKLSALEAGLSNRQKYVQGNLDSFAASDLVAVRRGQQRRFVEWARRQPDGAAGLRALQDVDALAMKTAEMQPASEVLGALSRTSSVLRAAFAIHWLALERAQPDAERQPGFQDRDVPELEGQLSQALKSVELEAERPIVGFLLARAARLPAAARIEGLDALFAQHADPNDTTEVLGAGIRQGAVNRLVDAVFSAVKLTDGEVRSTLLRATREVVEASGDSAVAFAASLAPDRLKERDRQRAAQGAELRTRPRLMAALAAHAGRPLYPDANGTLRVTYGKVRGYAYRDGLTAEPQTTLRGVVAKATGKAPFDAPQALLDAIVATHERMRSGQLERFGDAALGTVPVDFLSTCDVTGGNSGSATLDAKGRFVGLLFDGNYESMDSDWIYDLRRTRAIHVDVRYLLWSLERVYGGAHLLKELGL